MQRREFYIPRIDRERALYGSQFEVKLRNQLTQKAIAIECTYTPVNGFTTTDLGDITIEEGNSLDEQITVNEAKAKLEKQIEDLEKKARSEKQPRKRLEYFEQLKKLKWQI